MQRIIDEHKEMMRKMEENLEQEKQRQLSHLEGEIQRRRERKERKRRKQLADEEAKAVKADEEEEKRQMQEVQQTHAEQLQQQLKNGAQPPIPVNKTIKPEMNALTTPNQHVKLPQGIQLGDTDLNQLLMSTPLFNQLTEIHRMLEFQSHPSPTGHVDIGDNGAYIDLKDAQWECKGELVPVDTGELKPSDFVVYRFGKFVASLLYKNNHLPEVTLVIASNLPPNNYTRNCFRNSFFYQHSKNILYIRKERLESVGEFVVVILHCLSHVRVGDLVNDGNPLFLREFYQVQL